MKPRATAVKGPMVMGKTLCRAVCEDRMGAGRERGGTGSCWLISTKLWAWFGKAQVWEGIDLDSSGAHTPSRCLTDILTDWRKLI